MLRRLYLLIDEAAVTRLVALAKRERRTVHDQAGILLERLLLRPPGAVPQDGKRGERDGDMWEPSSGGDPPVYEPPPPEEAPSGQPGDAGPYDDQPIAH